MPSTYNRTELIGHVGHEPDFKYVDGKPFARFSVATDRPGPPAEDDRKPDWHQIVCWEAVADRARNLTKGRLVFVAGRLTYRAWETGEGKVVHSADIVARDLVLLGPGRREPDMTEACVGTPGV